MVTKITTVKPLLSPSHCEEAERNVDLHRTVGCAGQARNYGSFPLNNSGSPHQTVISTQGM